MFFFDGIVYVVFGYSLLKLKKHYGLGATVAGILSIIIGLCCLTIILSLLSVFLMLILDILMILLLFKASGTSLRVLDEYFMPQADYNRTR